MPLYEYRCGHCNLSFEKYARTFNDRPDCPGCGRSDPARQFSTFAVSTGGGSGSASSFATSGGCGEGPPCGAAHCGRLPN